MKKVRVNFFDAEVKYSGSLEDYTIEQLKAMALAKADRGVDCWDHSEIMDEDEAKKIDGLFKIERDFPCNHLVNIAWSYIDDSWEEEDEE